MNKFRIRVTVENGVSFVPKHRFYCILGALAMYNTMFPEWRRIKIEAVK